MQATATSTAATAELTTRTVVEGVRRDIQAQLDVTRADALRRSEEATAQVRELSVQLASLAEQLNKFNPASGTKVEVGYAQIVSDVDKRFAVQQGEIKTLSNAILDQQKSLQSNAEMLHGVLTGVENLGENVKNLQEEMLAWQIEYQEEEEAHAEMNKQLLQEFPLVPEKPEPTEKINLPGDPLNRNKVPANPKNPMPTIPEETAGPMVSEPQGRWLSPEEEQDMRRRWEKLTTGPRSVDVAGTEQPAVKYGNERGIPVSQATIPQFFGNKGSQTGIAQESQPGTGVYPGELTLRGLTRKLKLRVNPVSDLQTRIM